MIERCYNEKASSYPAYGNKNVTVCERWLCFENYLKDIINIEGYDFQKYINGEIQLDKDLKFKNNKEYCPEKCIFVDVFTNKSNQPSKLKKFKAISPHGEEYIYENQAACAREFNLTTRTIGKVLSDNLKSHKGWKFYYL